MTDITDIGARIRLNKIMEKAKQNELAIMNCDRHLFEDMPAGTPGAHLMGVRLTCTHCRGVMEAIQAFRYVQGYAAAGGDPNDVLPGFAPIPETTKQ